MTHQPSRPTVKRSHRAAALLLALVLLLQPVAAFAAPLGQDTFFYEDPNGMFSLDVPSAFELESPIEYEDIASAPLDDLLGSYGHIWGDDGDSVLLVMMLMLDDVIDDGEEFSQFVTALQASLGGSYLEQTEIDLSDAEGFIAVGSLVNDERIFLIGILADGNTATFVIVSLAPEVYDELSIEIDAALNTFGWDAQAIRAYFGTLSPTDPPEPTGPAELEIVTYEDPDGIFAIDVPDLLTSQDIVYEESGGEPIDGVLANRGRAFFDEAGNVAIALFFLLDEELADAEALLDFSLRFQEAAGGEYLPQADLQVIDDQNLIVAAEVDIPERYFLIVFQGQGSVVTVLSINVDPALMEAQGDVVSNMLNTFDWDPDAAEAALTEQIAETEPTAEPTVESTTEPTPESTPEATETPTAEPTPTEIAPAEPLTGTDSLTETVPLTETAPATTTESTTATEPITGIESGGDLEYTRYTHPDGVFSLLVPVGLEPALTDPEAGGYAYSFTDPADENGAIFPPLSVSLVGTGNVLDAEATEPLFTELSDGDFAALIDQIVTELGDLTVVTDIRDAANRTAYVVVETGPLFEDDSGLRLSLWIEENEGLLALVTTIGTTPPEGEEDIDVSPVVFQQALTTFSLDTNAAKRSIYEVLAEEGLIESAPAPLTEFVDPFGLVQLRVPDVLAFRQGIFQDGGFSYTFSNSNNQAVLNYSVKDVNPQSFTAAEWAELVELSGEQLLQNSPGDNPEILSSEVGVPAYAEGNSALVRGQTGRFQIALVLHEIDGVMATSVFLLRNDLWDANEAAIQELIDAGTLFDPEAVRAAEDERADSPFALTATTMTGSIPAEGADVARKYLFERRDAVVTLIGAADPELSGELNHVLRWEQRPDLPVAAFAADLEQESIETADIVVRRDDSGTRIAFALTPDYPLPAGRYSAQTFYDDLLFVAHEFHVTDAEQSAASSATLSLLLLDPTAPIGAPPVAANVLHTGDRIAVRGTGDIPGPATLRLFWFDPEGALLADSVQTVRSEGGYLANEDYFTFAPRFPWQEGAYSYLLTLNGEPLTSGGVQVIDAGEEVELTDDGADLLDALPLPDEAELAETVEGIDLAIVANVDFPTESIYGVVAAFLRGQGWTETLPTPDASPDIYFQRWVKGSYEVVITPGAEDAADEVWIDYRAIDADENALLPLGLPLSAETMVEIGEVAVLPLAEQTLRAAAYSPDGAWIAALTPDGWLVLLDAATLDVKQWWTLEDAGYSSVTFSPDSGELAATVAGDGGFPVQIFKNYDVVWLPVTTLLGHGDVPFGIAYTASPEILLTTGLDGQARFWSLPSGISSAWRTSGGILDVDFTPDRDLFLASLDNRTIEVWGTEEEPIYSFAVLEDADFAAPQVAMMPVTNEDGTSEAIVYGGNGPAEWWFIREDGAELISPVPPDNADFNAAAAAFSPDGEIVVIGGPSLLAYERVTGSYLGTWDVTDAEGEPLNIIRLSFSPDGQMLLIVTSDGALHFWAVTD